MTEFKIEVQGSGTASEIIESLRILSNSLEEAELEDLTVMKYEDTTLFSIIQQR